MLYPQSNLYRSVTNLNGIWNFKAVEPDYVPTAPLTDGMPMAVPASFNELVVDKTLCEHVGKVVYEREFSVPIDAEKIYRLRIGATSHKCEIYLNGKKAGTGLNGFLPIDIPVENLQEKNRLSVVIDNRLNFQTFPAGMIKENGKQEIKFDFYNFTGIHRDVLLYSLPKKHIEDIQINTVVGGDYRKITVNVQSNCGKISYRILDEDGAEVAASKNGALTVENPKLWSPEHPHLYTLAVETETDKYEETFGIRKVSYDENGLLLNGERVYLTGFGMHEDFFLLGKGNNAAVNVRNFELLKWTHANSVRTSHYPYSEEFMSLADRYGIMVIDEVPAVGMNHWEPTFAKTCANDETRAIHKELIRQLLARDKNHPCVVMVSVANEAATYEKAARPYFEDVINYTRKLTDLPITMTEETKEWEYEGCQTADLVDFIGLNRYFGWYEEHGDLKIGTRMLVDEFEKWHKRFKKPILVTEFGADTIEGLHALPSVTFSEEYQREFLEEYCRVFDTLPYVVGEHVWNFADFKTKQGTIRVRGNRKGVFTKERQPKLAAFFLRERWSNKHEK